MNLLCFDYTTLFLIEELISKFRLIFLVLRVFRKTSLRNTAVKSVLQVLLGLKNTVLEKNCNPTYL